MWSAWSKSLETANQFFPEHARPYRIQVASILPLLVQTYLGRYPDVELQLHHMNPDDQLAAFDEGMLDLGFSRALPAERRRYFEEEIVYVDHMAAILPPSHPLAKENLLVSLDVLGTRSCKIRFRGEPIRYFV